MGTRKGLLLEGCCGSVFERFNADFDIVDRSLGRPPSPHVNCRRRGFEDGPGITREELVVLDGVLSTADECSLAIVTRDSMLCTHCLVLQ